MTVKRGLSDDNQHHKAKRLCHDTGAVSWSYDRADLDLNLEDLSTQADQFLEQVGVCSGVHAAADNSITAQFRAESVLADYSSWRGLSEQAWRCCAELNILLHLFKHTLDWNAMYQPTTEQAEKDRLAAYEAGVPHGYVPPGNKYKDLPTIHLQVVSELHDSNEYGAEVQEDGQHCGGPFYIDVSPTMRIEDLRLVIQEVGGVVPALQKLSYAGKNFEDSQRSLQQYGVAYWHKKFPHWPIKICKC